MDDFQQEVVEILVNKAVAMTGKPADSLGPDTSFVEDLGCKSVNIVQFAAALEDEYEVEVPFMELNKCKTFREAAELVDKKLSM